MSNRSGWRVNCLVVGVLAVLVFTLAATASAQETTGGIQGYVKDKSGGSINKASVEVTSTALLTPRKSETDEAGFFHFALLPPGEYTLAISAQGFRTYKRTGIMLEVGKLPTYDITMEVGSVSETVEVRGEAPIVDTTTSKVAVAIPQDVIQNVPKGRSYQSLIPFAPGARQEPLMSRRDDPGRSNGFQIDGASDSENTYLVEGLDTGEVKNGGIKQNIVFEFVQEVQVKSSGFEAEYGGAVGGVVNVVQKRGSNEWHGDLVTYIRANALDANDQCAITPSPNPSSPTLSGQQLACGLRADPSTAFNSATRSDQAAQYYVQKQDNYRIIEPGFDIGGPLLKDRLWLFASYIPTLQSVSRTVNFTGRNPGPRTFTQSYNTHNAMGRLDYQAFSKLHLYGSWVYGYSRVRGQLPLTPDSVTGQINSAASTDPTTIRADTGSVNPSNILNVGGDWTPTSHLVIASRYGQFYYNSSDRGKPTGLRYIYQADLVAANLGLDGQSINSAFFNTSPFANISSNFQNIFDALSRRTFQTDFSYIVSKGGTHNFKFGYGFNRLSENLLSGFNTAQVLIYWTQDYTPGTTAGQTACNQIIASNVTAYGASAAGHCRGNDGYFIVRDGVDAAGVASSFNHGLYVQDAWTVGHGLTLNIGVRFDKEFLPPFSAGASSISFGFTDKVAPRIGGAYDLLHNGKLKVFASYGKFFDIMKYSLPRGSFGGEYWHDCVYAMDNPDYNQITPTAPNNHGCPVTGPAPGVTVGRFIENQDFRFNVLSTTDPGVDPNIKPMEQHEIVIGADWAITPKTGLEVRYARKRLDRTIEDIGVTDAFGFYIGNPGPNTYADLLHRPLPSNGFTSPLCPTCPVQPTAIRHYDGLEFRLTHRGTNLFGQVSYTYSRLRGNYAGLTNSDITDGNGGRHSPNNHRDFDQPEMQFTTSGQVQDGPLSTDRPHVVGMVGWYRLKWLGMETTFGANQLIASGTPESTCWATINTASSCMYFQQRGVLVKITRDPTTGDFVNGGVTNGARTPMLTQTDFNIGHTVRVSKSNEALRLGFEANILNLFNQASVLSINPIPIAGTNTAIQPPSTTNPSNINWLGLLSGFDPFAAANAKTLSITAPLTVNNRYGLPFLFQTRRTIRLAIRFTF